MDVVVVVEGKVAAEEVGDVAATVAADTRVAVFVVVVADFVVVAVVDALNWASLGEADPLPRKKRKRRAEEEEEKTNESFQFRAGSTMSIRSVVI